MLRFEGHGVGFAHLTLPADQYGKETRALKTSAEQLRGCIEHQVYYLTGHSDVMLAIRLADFRKAFHFNYESEATGTNWLFGVPYLPSLYPASHSERFALTYVVHLRIVRDVFREAGVAAEERIVEEIQRLLTNDIRGEVLAGFGWSDLMVSGTFESFTAFTSTVEKIQSLEINGRPAIRRVLTILGYAADVIAKPTEMTVRPVMLARAAPNRILITAQMLKKAIDPEGTTQWNATSIDGKWDVVLEAKGGAELPLQDFVTRHQNLAESNNFATTGLERLETHLLTRDLFAEPDIERAEQKNFQPYKCSCQISVRPLSSQLSALIADVKPAPLSAAIKNVLGLFRAASKDPLNCCEVSSPLRRCEIGLGLLLTHRAEVVAEMTAVTKIERGTKWKTPVYWYSQFNQAHINVQDWCTYAERIVSQRTVGRFEEFLSQNERVVSYRGGIQKLLYLADELLNLYATRIDTKARAKLPMVCLFDPIDIVLSHRYAGLVRMPSRYLFVLPLAINHLWHEVGEYAFFQKPASARERVTKPNHRVAQTDLPQFTLDVGDVYADSLTLIHGYRGDLKPFVVATATALFETPSFGMAPPAVKDRFMVYLLLRLYLASECNVRATMKFLAPAAEACTSVAIDDPAHSGNDTGENSEALEDAPSWMSWLPNQVEIDIAIRGLADYLRDELLIYRRYRPIAVTDEIITQAINNINDTVAHGFRPFIVDIVEELPKVSSHPVTDATNSAFASIASGELVDFASVGADINDVFRLMQIRMIEELRSTPAGTPYDGSFFRELAALMRSSILTFYKMETHLDEEDEALERLLG